MMNERGFTLAELLVSLAVLSVVLLGTYTLQQQGLVTYMMGAARVEAQQNARLALDMLTRELRSAQSLTTVTNCNTGTNAITFNDENGVSVQYQLVSGNLQRNAATLIGGVQSLTITCYQADGTTATATAANVRNLVVSLVAMTEEFVNNQPAGFQAYFQSRVRLRNAL